MAILSYGALLSKNKTLQNQVDKLTRFADCLLQESSIQKKLIMQLKQLYESCSNSNLLLDYSCAIVVISSVGFLIRDILMLTVRSVAKSWSPRKQKVRKSVNPL